MIGAMYFYRLFIYIVEYRPVLLFHSFYPSEAVKNLISFQRYNPCAYIRKEKWRRVMAKTC